MNLISCSVTNSRFHFVAKNRIHVVANSALHSVAHRRLAGMASTSSVASQHKAGRSRPWLLVLSSPSEEPQKPLTHGLSQPPARPETPPRALGVRALPLTPKA